MFLIIFILGLNILFSAPMKILNLLEGESREIRRKYQIQTAAVGNPEVADVASRGVRSLIILGKKPGVTSLSIWGKKGEKEVFRILVNRSILPKPIIQVSARILEVKLNALKKLGIDWTDTINFKESEIPGVFKVGKLSRITDITAKFKYMLQNGDARILAKPNLVALSEGSAQFKVGGEIPIPTPDQQGSVTIDWKEYGVILKISPVGNKETNLIQLKIYAEVSVVDYGAGITFQGYSVPAITKRTVETEVQAEPGDTIVLAGLNKKIETKTVKKIPIVGNLPLIGYLFGSEDSKKEDSEITIFLTPTFLEK